ncbi:hypothetical protein Cgig2_014653 [Carnegiea gigantea]|uniref:MADS-box domain-containing protein n=1 Tax=Carnegiea gigantea TaxID=171969 RepID=A0A9Q1L1E7_9CARY|nr:hypothetical protein Cgig2_014653 [Carnegiea gigantea]
MVVQAASVHWAATGVHCVYCGLPFTIIMVKPISKGRQKLEMKKIQNRASLGVTFTKRRGGIFKKANELVTLCGAELAVIVFSPGRKAYSFGHPNVYTILNRILYHLTNSRELFAPDNNGVDKPKDKINQLFAQYDAIQKQTEVERMTAKLEKEASTMQMPPRSQLTYGQSLQLHSMMQDLKMRVSSELQRRIFMEYASMNTAVSSSAAPGGNSVIIAPDNNYGVLGFSNLGASGEGSSSVDPNKYCGVGSSMVPAPEENIIGPSKNHGEGFRVFNAPENVSIPSPHYGTWEF